MDELEKKMGLDKLVPDVDRSARTLADGSPVEPGHAELRADGQQRAYVVLSDDERARGFVRPVRTSYVHEKCKSITTMGRKIAETYARDPEFYTGTYCVTCRAHFPVGPTGEFRWLVYAQSEHWLGGDKVGT